MLFGDQFIYSHGLRVWYSSVILRRNEVPVIVSGKSETTKFLCLVQLDIISKWPKRLLNGSKNEQTTNKDQKKKQGAIFFLTG